MNDFAPIAKVITDSVSTETGHRLTTLELTLHPYTLTQLLAHRAFSRTVDTSISTTAQVRAATDRPVYPALWIRDNGDSAATPLHHTKTRAAREAWDAARNAAAEHAEKLTDLGVHRSIVNRLLTPYAAVTALVTATDWTDFFEQRLAVPNPTDPLVDTEMTGLALAMREAIEASIPEKLQIGYWHLPRLDEWELTHFELTAAIQASVTRCANDPDNGRDRRFDRENYRRLFAIRPPHWSPLEHVATPAATTEHVEGNYSGWHQLRHLNPSRFA